MTNLTECLIQLIEKGCVVFQILLENRKLFFHDHIQPMRFEERLGYLWQTDHLIYKRELADILTNMALNGKRYPRACFCGDADTSPSLV